jgi:hypothetical protein
MADRRTNRCAYRNAQADTRQMIWPLAFGCRLFWIHKPISVLGTGISFPTSGLAQKRTAALMAHGIHPPADLEAR